MSAFRKNPVRRALLAAIVLPAALIAAPPAAAAPPAPSPSAQPADPLALGEAEASSLAQSSGAPVEATALTGERQRVMALPDGTFQAEVTPEPARVQKDREWVDIDAGLVQAGDRLAQKAVAADQSFSAGGEGPAALYRSPGGTQLTLDWPTPLPKPKIEGATALYPGASPGADLVLEGRNDGFQAYLVLNQRPKPGLGAVSFPISGDGIAFKQIEGGGYDILDPAGDVMLHVAAPLAWDSSVDKDSGNARLAPIRTRITGDKGAYAIEVAVDEEFLQDPATVYPVTIDPTLGQYDAGHTYVDSAYPNQSYLGDDWDALGLHVGTFNGGGSVNRAMFIYPGGSFLGAQIIDADWNTYETYSWSCNAREVQVFHTNPWGGGITWNNQPAAGGPWTSQNVAMGYNSSCPANPLGFDVTGMVAALAGGGWGTYYLQLRAANEGDSLAWKKFATNPSLVVTYNHPPATPTNLGSPFSQTPCHITNDAANPRYNNVVGPITLSAVQSDADGNLQTAFDLYKGDLSYQYPSTWTASVASGTVSVNINQGLLTATGTYAYRAISMDNEGAWSGYSQWCWFNVDNTPPNQPTVTSTYFTSTDINNPVRTVGDQGPITFSANGSGDVIKYFYTANPQGLPTNLPTTAACNTTVGITTVVCPGTPGGSVTTTVRLGGLFLNDMDPDNNASTPPPIGGASTIFVRSYDGLNTSVVNPKMFALSYAPYNHIYTFDTVNATDPITGLATEIGDDEPNAPVQPLTLVGTVSYPSPTLVPDPHWDGSGAFPYSGDALLTTGSIDSYASAPKAFDTDGSRSFAVAAWLKVSSTPAGQHWAVSQEGAVYSAFTLGTIGSNWTFCINSDTSGVCVSNPTPIVVGTWTFVAGVYDAVEGKVRVIVGDPTNDPPSVVAVSYGAFTGTITPAATSGRLLIGRGKLATSTFAGGVDTVVTWAGMPSVNDLFYAYKN